MGNIYIGEDNMGNVEKRKRELDNVMQEFDSSARNAWTKIAVLEGDKSMRASAKIAKIKDIIMQEVSEK